MPRAAGSSRLRLALVATVIAGAFVSLGDSIIDDTPAAAATVVSVPATWTLSGSTGANPNVNCNQWLTSAAPPGTVSATVTISGAGGGGGTYDKGDAPSGGSGGQVTTQVTVNDPSEELSVLLGCGGSTSNYGYSDTSPPPGGTGFAPGGSIDDPPTGADGFLYGGGGGGASALCVGVATCTTQLVVAGGGGGAGGEDDCLATDSAGNGGSGWGNVTPITSGHDTVEPGAGGQTGDEGTGGGAGTGSAGAGGTANGSGGGPPSPGGGGTGGQRAGQNFLGSGGGGGAGYAGGGGGGGDGCTYFEGAAGGGGGGGSSAITTANLVSGTDSFAAGAPGGTGFQGSGTGTVTCPEDDNAVLSSGCPGYVSLTWNVEPLVFELTSGDPDPTTPASSTATVGPFSVHVRKQDGSLYRSGTFTVSLDATGVSGSEGVDYGFAATEQGAFLSPGSSTVTTSEGIATFWFGDRTAGDHPDITSSDGGNQCGTSCTGGQVHAPVVVSGPAASFRVTGSAPGQVTASSTANAGPYAVTVQDALGNVVTAGTYSITLSASGAGSGAGSRYGFATTSGGGFLSGTPTVHTFHGSATFWFGDENPGTPTLAANDPADQCGGHRCTGGTIAGPTVVAGAATAFAITTHDTHSTQTASGRADGGPYVVGVTDAFGNRVGSGSYDVTLSATGATGVEGTGYGFAAIQGGAFDSAPTPITTSGGTATFWFGDETAGDVPTLKASDTSAQCGGSTCTSASVAAPTVTPAAAHAFVITGHDTNADEPASATANGGPYEVTVEDPFGNLVPTGSYDVSLRVTGASGSEGTDYGFAATRDGAFSAPPASVTTSGGTATFWFGDGTGGDHPVVNVSDQGTQCGANPCSGHSVAAPAISGAASFAISEPSPPTSNKASDHANIGPGSLKVLDAQGQLVTAGTFTVSLGVTGATGIEGTNYGFAASEGGAFDSAPVTLTTSAGTAAFWFGDETPGDRPVLSAGDAGTQCGGVACSSSTVDAPTIAGQPTKFVITGVDPQADEPASVVANGGPWTVSVEDRFGTVVADGHYTVTLGADGVTGAAGADWGFAPGSHGNFLPDPTVVTSSGVATFWFGDTTVGDSPTVVASDTGAQCSGTDCAPSARSAPPIVAGLTVHGSPPPATVGVPYATTLTISGGTAPYTWTIAGGHLPAGLQLNPGTGTISGSPTAVSSSAFTLRVTDAHGLVATAQESVTVADGSTPAGGYWEVGSDGGIYGFGGVGFFGSTGGRNLTAPVVGMAATPDDGGYWEAGSDGGVFAFGDAGFLGSMGGLHLNAPVVGMAATPDGGGYWLVAADGGIFAFGDAGFFGSMGGTPLNAPVVGIAATADGGGYREVAADGGIFAFGDATYLGSTGSLHLNAPIVAIAAPTATSGYWLAGADGGIFTFGPLGYFGSMAGQHLNAPIVGAA